MSQTIFNFFGLRENPFKINPDPRFLFVTDQARATSDELTYAIRTRKGLVLLTGEVGTGKTMLLRNLLNWLSEQKMPTALIFNSHIQPDHLLDFILNDFGVPCASPLKSEKLMALNRWLLERYRAAQIPVLIVDEAQGLEPAALEEIRLLLNFETPREKLLQIVLAGQPELEIKLKRHELRQLRQRITTRCRTAPLDLEQTYGYINERLRVAGANGKTIFQPDAVGSLHAYSHGIPRVINVLCEHSMVNACADGSSTVSSKAVEQAAHDCQLDRSESVARILKTGSYSTTSLSEISSMLAAISAASDSPDGPPRRSEFAERPPGPPMDSRRQAPPTAENSAPENSAPSQPVAWASPARQQYPSTATSSPPPAQSEAVPVEISFGQAPVSRPHQPANLLYAWSRSFVRDVRAASRQLRRALHRFETRRWGPFVRTLRREFHELGMRTSQLSTRTVSESQAIWRSLKNAIPSRLLQVLGTQRRVTPRHVKTGVPSGAKRPRAIVSLRRWLHEPLTTQHKRTQGNQRRLLS
jgi:general secretion pathway protein A